MSDSPTSPQSDHEPGIEPEDDAATGTPGWVKVFVVIALAVVVVVVALLLVGGSHGPGRHASAITAAALSLVA